MFSSSGRDRGERHHLGTADLPFVVRQFLIWPTCSWCCTPIVRLSFVPVVSLLVHVRGVNMVECVLTTHTAADVLVISQQDFPQVGVVKVSVLSLSIQLTHGLVGVGVWQNILDIIVSSLRR